MLGWVWTEHTVGIYEAYTNDYASSVSEAESSPRTEEFYSGASKCLHEFTNM